MRLKAWTSVAVIFAAVIAAYFFSIQAGYNSIDDLKMIGSLENSGKIDLFSLFVPHGGTYYYRPLTILTYLIDRDLWGTIPSFMHLENVLLHFISAVLVFFITRSISKSFSTPVNTVALMAALFFALHPLTTESVCWISGRTDLLAGAFLLLSVLLLLSGLQTQHGMVTVLSGIALLLACLAKEVAVFALPGMLWLVLAYPDKNSGLWLRMRQRWFSLAVPVAGVSVYFVMRFPAIARDTGVQTALKGVVASQDLDLFNKIRIAFKVYGFYFKKFLLPWPLNFGIVEVSHWYVIPGLALTALLLWFVWRRDMNGALCLTAFCVLSPALLIPFGKMAWTPIAERYLYIPIALAAPAVSIWFYRFKEKHVVTGQRRLLAIQLSVMLLFFATTIHRAWVWQDNERLYRDTVEKSPNFLPVQTELASALKRKGQFAEAEKILQDMQLAENTSSYVVDDLNLAGSLMERGEYKQAQAILSPLLNQKIKDKHKLLQSLLKLNYLRLGQITDTMERITIQKENLAWLLEQQKLRPNPFTIYRIGKVHLALGDRQNALASFKLAYAKSSATAHYHEAAGKLAKKLAVESGLPFK